MIAASDIEQTLRRKHQDVSLRVMKVLREDLIGSEALLKYLPIIIKSGYELADLKHCVLDHEDGGSLFALQCARKTVWELTVGCVALIHQGSWREDAQESQQAQAASAAATATARPNWNLFTEALAVEESAKDLLQRSKLDRSLFLNQVQQNRESGLFKDANEWSTASVRAALDDIDQEFLDMLGDAFFLFESGNHFLAPFAPEAILHAFDSVPALDQGANVQLTSEDVRVRGQYALECLARTRRNEGNELFKRGSALTGEEQAEAWKLACEKFELAVCETEEDAITYANLAAVRLAEKNYAEAVTAAHMARGSEIMNIPHSFESRRRFVVAAYSGDESLAKRFDGDCERNALLNPFDRDAIFFKSLIREGRAHKALFEDGVKASIAGQAVRQEGNAHDHATEEERGVQKVEDPWTHLKGGHKAFANALDLAGERRDEAVARKELKQLEKVFKWALLAETANGKRIAYRYTALNFDL